MLVLLQLIPWAGGFRFFLCFKNVQNGRFMGVSDVTILTSDDVWGVADSSCKLPPTNNLEMVPTKVSKGSN